MEISISCRGDVLINWSREKKWLYLYDETNYFLSVIVCACPRSFLLSSDGSWEQSCRRHSPLLIRNLGVHLWRPPSADGNQTGWEVTWGGGVFLLSWLCVCRESTPLVGLLCFCLIVYLGWVCVCVHAFFLFHIILCFSFLVTPNFDFL